MKLKNQHLEVILNKPGEVYQSSRFDWTGQIEQVILDQKYTFCTTETLDGSERTTKGFGLMNEFGITSPIGYADCKPGDFFPKIGTGLLLKDTDEPYLFNKSYKVHPASFAVEQSGAEKLKIASEIENCRGYQFHLEKQFEIIANQLFIRYRLKNTGTKSLETEEYCHNFININQVPVNNTYRLIFPVQPPVSGFIEEVNPGGCVKFDGNTITWKSLPESDFFYTDLNAGKYKINSWRIENSSVGAGVSESVDFEPAQCNLWGRSYVISPEIFIKINLNPGEISCWERRFTFFTV